MSLRLLVNERCFIEGCDRPAKFGYIACARHVRKRRREIRRYGIAPQVADLVTDGEGVTVKVTAATVGAVNVALGPVRVLQDRPFGPLADR